MTSEDSVPEGAGVALVTGGSRGIGAAWPCDWRPRLRHLAQLSLEPRGGGVGARGGACAGRECLLLPFDVADEKGRGTVLDPHLEDSTPAVLVNNAGFTRDALMMWMSADEWQAVTDVTLRGFFLVTRRVLTGMLRRRSGRIVNIASTAGQRGLPGQVNYSAPRRA